MSLRQLEKLPLDVECTNRLSVLKPDNPGARRVTRDIAGALNGIRQDKVFRQPPIFEQRKDARRCSDLQRSRKWTHVGIANEQVEPAIFPVIGQGLVPRVDDRAVELN